MSNWAQKNTLTGYAISDLLWQSSILLPVDWNEKGLHSQTYSKWRIKLLFNRMQWPKWIVLRLFVSIKYTRLQMQHENEVDSLDGSAFVIVLLQAKYAVDWVLHMLFWSFIFRQRSDIQAWMAWISHIKPALAQFSQKFRLKTVDLTKIISFIPYKTIFKPNP